MYVIKDNGEIGETLALVHLVEGAEEAFVEFIVADDEEGVISTGLDEFGINHQACRSGIEDDIFGGLSQLRDEFLKASVTE